MKRNYQVIPFDPNALHVKSMGAIPILTLRDDRTNEVIYVCKVRLKLSGVEWDGYAEFRYDFVGLAQVKGMSEEIIVLLAEYLKEERDKQKRIDDMANTLISLGQQEIQLLA